MNKTPIEWTDLTANPLRARNRRTGKRGHHCEKISQGCAHCYAAQWQGFRGTGLDFTRANRDQVELLLDEKLLLKMIRMKPPHPAKQWGAWLPFDQVNTDRQRMRIKRDRLKVCQLQTAAGLTDPLWRMGKRAAGRLLDGREWSEFPEVATCSSR
jgi:hypothetical protein